jgi:hypothetical protein
MNWDFLNIKQKTNMDKIDKVGETGLNSVLSDPFNKNSIESISVTYRQKIFDDGWYAYGFVKFKRGNTTAEQRFEADTFDEISLLIKSFINNEL